MNETADLPWTKKDIWLNLIAIIVLMGLATYMIFVKSWVLLIIYWLIWILYFTVGRYVTCHHCDFLGKACCSWCMGKIGGKLYKRSEKKNFVENGMWKVFVFALSFLFIAELLPIILYLYELFTNGLNLLDWLLLIIYFIIFIVMNAIHLTFGCNRCPTADCPFNRKKKKTGSVQ